ncbi:MAG: protein nirF [Gammaproteobacteria bacterium (ex Lamellibrachia satsuma)]|nr:MAG: protein nirF [Gammaproteobacteria bacterium (ex Lamellibrachia satsuma)]RRS33107.1 MAG: protein nirF [Gammaproteobacteria bacterium (ex Lamellibrachia satsuma)]RRS35532.1 MAG: protein nirF [Gammaproteobacteria bacterium (ex Lamellibrachia satsuma)]
MKSLRFLLVTMLLLPGLSLAECLTRGTGDMGIIIERAAGSLKVVDTTNHSELFRVEGLGDLSHASAVYSRNERYVYIFGRDGGLTKVDILCGRIVKRIIQGGNSIGGAISQDGSLIAVSNYKPGGVKIFSADDLSLIADIPATSVTDRDGHRKGSKTVGLVDAPDQRFVVSLYDSGESWIIDMSDPAKPAIQRFENIGSLPYDGLITPNGRYYIAGLFGQDGLSLLDLWHPEKGARLILDDYGRGQKKLPVYKMPHLEGWAMADDRAFLPAVGQHAVLVVDSKDWKEIKQVPVHGQPVFVMARPDGRQIWVNFAFPHNDTIQVIDTETLEIINTLKPGKGTLHMEFSPRGESVWISVRDKDEVQVYATRTQELTHRLPVDKPSGIFFTSRAHQTGL